MRLEVLNLVRYQAGKVLLGTLLRSEREALVPHWLLEDLGSESLLLGDVLRLTRLLDLAVCVFVSTELVHLLSLQGGFDSLGVNGRHNGVERQVWESLGYRSVVGRGSRTRRGVV